MNSPPCTVIEPAGCFAPLVIDSPHSGRSYPPDFAFACPLPLLRQTEDFLVDELVAGAVEAGATLIAAEFPRSYIDVNRAENDIDPAVLAETWDAPLELTERTALGLGLVRRLCMTGVPIYETPLTANEVRRRIDAFYRPYHAALGGIVERRMRMFGSCYLNCHSMPSRGHEDGDAQRADFVLGDRNGSSADPAFTRRVRDLLQDMGYSTAINEPYKGMEIVKRYGDPMAGRHALQIEINRRLYMDERKLEKSEGFAGLRQNLTAFFAALAADLLRDMPEPLAAE
jgi:N-formylglutamate deformylase